MIQIGKLLEGSAAFSSLRVAVHEIMATSLIRQVGGSAGADAERHRNFVKSTFLSSPEDGPLRSALVIFNGEWRSGELLHFCPGPHCCPNRDRTLKVANYVLLQLFRRTWRLFPRNNWIGCEKVLDRLGFLCNFHSLLQRGVIRAFGLTLNHGLQLLAEADQEGEDDAAEDDLARVRREKRSRDACCAIFLADADVAASFLHHRRVLQPQVLLMQWALGVSSTDWELKQMALESEAGVRTHRVLLQLHGEARHQFFQRLWVLLWDTSQPALSGTQLVHIFKDLAALGGEAYRLLEMRMRNYPYRTFLLLEQDRFAEEFAQVPSCLLDEWSVEWRAKWADGNVDVPLEGQALRDAQADLHTIATLALTDSVSVEKAHASNLRRVKSRPNTHLMTVEELAVWQSLRTLTPELVHVGSAMRGAGHRVEELRPGPGAFVDQPARAKKRKRGAWQAFLSEKLTSETQRPATRWTDELQALSREYQDLTPEQIAHYEALGVVLPAKRRYRKKKEKKARSLAAEAVAPDHLMEQCTVAARQLKMFQREASRTVETCESLTGNLF